MLRLRTLDARFGDCLILSHDDDHFLIDGGPDQVFERRLAPVLEAMNKRGEALRAVILSHVDTDHTTGLDELLATIDAQRQNGEPDLIAIDELWLNSFGSTIGMTGLQPRLAGVLSAMSVAGVKMALADVALAGIKHGDALVTRAHQLTLPLRAQPLLAKAGGAPITYGQLALHVVGPTQANLDALKVEWEEWIAAQEKKIAAGKLQLAANSDQTIPNLSSIQLLVVAPEGTMLLTGDGRSDHLLEGLELGGHLDDKGALHVDVLKVAHHGSDRNVTRRFFEKVTADIYVISADGKHDNPDFATLTWIVEAADRVGRQIKLVLTNSTPSSERLVVAYPPAQWGYTLKVRANNRHSIDVTL